MQTHDEETRRFFKHSSVQVLLCPRSAGKGHSWAKKQVGYMSLVVLEILFDQDNVHLHNFIYAAFSCVVMLISHVCHLEGDPKVFCFF